MSRSVRTGEVVRGEGGVSLGSTELQDSNPGSRNVCACLHTGAKLGVCHIKRSEETFYLVVYYLLFTHHQLCLTQDIATSTTQYQPSRSISLTGK